MSIKGPDLPFGKEEKAPTTETKPAGQTPAAHKPVI